MRRRSRIKTVTMVLSNKASDITLSMRLWVFAIKKKAAGVTTYLECGDMMARVNELFTEGVESEHMTASIEGVDHQDIQTGSSYTLLGYTH